MLDMHHVEDDNEELILPFIRDLCPDQNEEELEKASDRFREYVDLVLRISIRVVQEEQKRGRN